MREFLGSLPALALAMTTASCKDPLLVETRLVVKYSEHVVAAFVAAVRRWIAKSCW